MASRSSARSAERLLREFDATADRVNDFVVERYGRQDAEAIRSEARKRYAEIIPQIPHLEEARARVFNSFLGITAQEVALYLAISDRGGTASDAWEVCHEAIRLRMQDFPTWKRRLARRFMFSGFVRRIMRRRQANEEQPRFGEFEIRYLAGDDDEFDVVVDYLGCGNLELVKMPGAEEFAPYVCMSDIALSDGLGRGLTRTQTLADGCSHCDFRFKKDGPTRITSKTPEVQATIDRIEATHALHHRL